MNIPKERIEDMKRCIRLLPQTDKEGKRIVYKPIWLIKEEILDIIDTYCYYSEKTNTESKLEMLESIRNELKQDIQNGVIHISSGNEALFEIINRRIREECKND